MAIAGITISAEIAGLRELQRDLGRIFSKADKAKIMKAVLTKAIEPAYARLKELTPVGPTGNLKRAVAKKVIGYASSGNAVALIGFRRTGRGQAESAAGGSVQIGPDRAFHQWWLEEGTKERTVNTFSNTPYMRKSHIRRMKSGVEALVLEHLVKGQNAYIASSYRRLGPFKFKRPGDRDNVQTEPPYQRAFFKKSPGPITIPPMPPGGNHVPPLKTAWEQTRGQVAEIIQRELRLTLEQAVSTLSQSSTGTI